MNKYISTSVFAGLLAMTVIATAMPVATAQAQSVSSMQAQIAALLTQIQQLQAILDSQDVAEICPYTWNRTLNMGSTGTDVRTLQKFLNSHPDTRVSAIGAGSQGFETSYYGPLTGAAVAKFQNKYKSSILTPIGLTTPTTFFGNSTKAKMNSLCDTTPTPTPPTTPTTPTNPSTPTTPVSVLQGEGDLDTFEIETADDDTIAEAAADAPIALLTLEANNGDIEISRMDISLVADTANDERDPWDVFEDVSLWVDGEKIAELVIDDRSDYLNRTDGTIRFSNLNLILEEDEEVEVTIAASVQNSVDGAGSNATWSVSVDSLRFKDAMNVVATDTTTGDLQQSVDFEIVERGDGEELKFKTSTNNPAEQTVIIDDSQRTNNVTILGYSIEALGGDIELDRLYVNVQTGTASFNDVVSDIRLKIGSNTFKKDSVVSSGSYSSNNVLVSFDIDNKVTIDEDDEQDVSVIVDFKAKTAYANGETIFAQITSAERDMTEAEGADDVEAFSGSIVGKVQTLIAEGVYVPTSGVKMTTNTLGTNSTIGVYTIEFTVNAVEDDFYITDQASTSNLTSIGGIQYSVDTTVGTPTSVTAVLSSTANEDTNGVFTIREGRSETFTLIVTVDAATAGNHRVAMNAVRFSANNDGVTSGATYTVTPTNQFRTPYQFINN